MKKRLFLLICIAAIYMLMVYWTPLQYDDLMFYASYREYAGGEDAFHWNALWDYAMNMREVDNSRLANILLPFMIIFSPGKELFPFVTGIFCALLVLLTAKCSRLNGRVSLFQLIFTWICIILFLPWRNSIFVADFASNYLYSSLITLGMLLWMLRSEKRGWSAVDYTVGIILAIIAGGWHEGFAVPTIGGLIIYGLWKRKSVSRGWWIVTAIYFVAAAIFGLSPAMVCRFKTQIHNAGDFTGYFKMIADLALVFAETGLGIIALCIPAGRRFLRRLFDEKPWLVIIGIAMVASAIISVDMHASSRTAYFPELCAIILLMGALDMARIRLGKRAKTVSGTLMLILCLAQSAAALAWQYRFNEEHKEIIRELLTTETGTIFRDVLRSEDVPLFTLYFPSRGTWITPYQYKSMLAFYNKDIMAVVPRVLSDTTLADKKVGAAYLHGNALWMPKDSIPKGTNSITFEVKRKNSNKYDLRKGIAIRYIDSRKDTLIYIKIYQTDPTLLEDVRVSQCR